MKWLISLMALLVITGCTSPTVFLTTERLAKEDRAELITVLSQSGFQVEPTIGVRIPEAFPDVVVATNPANENPDFFSKLERIIQQQSLAPVSYQKLYQQKHYYKGRDVGLYVRGNEPELRLPPVLRGDEDTCNGQRIILEFINKNKLKIDVEGEEIISYTADYRTVLPNTVYANLESVDNTVKFKLSQVSVETYAGMRTADKLVVTSNGNSILPIGCEFMIIHY
ncbi:hypothetical protein [Idiomarina sp. HP20-50]|uniref:hypothetical protein n=1 Tax=Idiomarina sp. HP20-50 TaxID=3070813 RepID=UPI00294AB36F|nr:hypothetical protein [Idiomarina sp. HP20-50]MDV6316774.1 hypothetical protein [Idiomarina sp. HP20-50]